MTGIKQRIAPDRRGGGIAPALGGRVGDDPNRRRSGDVSCDVVSGLIRDLVVHQARDLVRVAGAGHD